MSPDAPPEGEQELPEVDPGIVDPGPPPECPPEPPSGNGPLPIDPGVIDLPQIDPGLIDPEPIDPSDVGGDTPDPDPFPHEAKPTE
jgi:hypothetical protein